MRINEMRQIVNMLDEEWDLGKTPSRSRGKVCAYIYLFEILEESEYLFVEKCKNNIVGICGYSNYHSKKYIFRKKFYKILKYLLIYSPFVKNKAEIKKYLSDYDYTPDYLRNYFDGEISILIVNKKYRGQKIGKKLLDKTFEKAKLDGMKNLQILSDESSNYQFYERCGCQKIYEKLIDNGEPDKFGNVSYEMGYILEKKLR